MPATFFAFRRFVDANGLRTEFDDVSNCYEVMYGRLKIATVPSRVAWREFSSEHENEILTAVNLFRCFS